MKRILACLAVTAVIAAPSAHARKRQPTWQVMRATDPITRASTCAVVASDFVGRTRFTRMGAIYPVVENNSTYGLLVGVSSGGEIRLPTGDILWVVDDNPHRELRAIDNPSPDGPMEAPTPGASLEQMTAWGTRLGLVMTATSTMASGGKAREMLGEMLAGTSLLFRSAGTGTQTGLPDYSSLMAGQMNEDGELRPIPLDGTLREGLQECGIVSEDGVVAPAATSG